MWSHGSASQAQITRPNVKQHRVSPLLPFACHRAPKRHPVGSDPRAGGPMCEPILTDALIDRVLQEQRAPCYVYTPRETRDEPAPCGDCAGLRSNQIRRVLGLLI